MSGTIFKGKTRDGKPCLWWKDVHTECAKHHTFILEFRPYDENAEISGQQRKWLHSDWGPIHLYMKEEKKTFADAKIFVKVMYGREWFVTVITDDNVDKAIGPAYWECKKTQCQEIFHIKKAFAEPGKRTCSKCGSIDIQLIAIKSINDISVRQTQLWFDEIFDKHPILKKMYDEWKEKEQAECG